MKSHKSYSPSKQALFARILGDLGRVLWLHRDFLTEQDRHVVIAQVNQLSDLRLNKESR